MIHIRFIFSSANKSTVKTTNCSRVTSVSQNDCQLTLNWQLQRDKSRTTSSVALQSCMNSPAACASLITDLNVNLYVRQAPVLVCLYRQNFTAGSLSKFQLTQAGQQRYFIFCFFMHIRMFFNNSRPSKYLYRTIW